VLSLGAIYWAFTNLRKTRTAALVALGVGITGAVIWLLWISSQIAAARTPTADIARLRNIRPTERAATVIDFEHDGVIDLGDMVPQSLGLASATADSNGDGAPDIEMRALRDHIEYIEDANFDGWADYVRTTKIANHVVTITEESDLDGDGTLESRITRVQGAAGWHALREERVPGTDTFRKIAESNVPFISHLSLDGVDVSFHQCGDLTKSDIEAAFRDALDIGLPCLETISPTAEFRLASMLVRAQRIEIECEPMDDACGAFKPLEIDNSPGPSPVGMQGDIRAEDLGCDPLFNSCDIQIYVTPPSKSCPRANLAAVIFHELLHAAQFRMGLAHDTNHADPVDHVWGCGDFCFPYGAGNQSSKLSDCRRCVGQTGPLPDQCPTYRKPRKKLGTACYDCGCSPTGQPGHFQFEDLAECTKRCVASLACFNATICGECSIKLNRK
jgi:hypothetical protein